MKLKGVAYKSDMCEIYPWKWGLEVVLTNDVNRYALMRGWFGYEYAAAFHRADPENNKSVVVLPRDESYGVIAHEAYHVLCSVYRSRAVRSRDEEAVGYFLEDVTNVIIAAIDAMRKKKWRYLTAAKGDRR